MRIRLPIIIVTLLLIVGLPAYSNLAHGTVTWPTTPTLAANGPGADVLPSALQASDGTVWVTWQSNQFNPLSAKSDIFYKTFSAGVSSPQANITSPFDDVNSVEPALAQLGNGTVLLFWNGNATGTHKIYYERFFGGVWSPRVQATTGTSNDCYPATAIGRNGTLWLFWTRGTSCYGGSTNIFYKTLKGGSWSAETQLTFDTALNAGPRATATNDGRIWVVFAQYQNAGKEDQIFDIIYNGATWGPETQFISTNFWEDHPSIMQDRNGTLWVFWTREIPINAVDSQDDIYGAFSITNGASFSAPAPLTFDPTGFIIDDWGPSAIQGADHTVWLFYSSDYPQGGNFDIYYVQSSPIFPVHHLTVSQIVTSTPCPFPKLAPSSPSCLYPGGMITAGESSIVKANVTVTNPGDFSETVNVQLSAVNTTSYSVGSLTATTAPGGKLVLSFTWNTTRSEKAGRYGLLATIPSLPGETLGNQGDNSLLTNNLVHLIPLGDVDQDGSVDFRDASTVAYAFQSTPAVPSRWNAYSDFDNDYYINFLDVSTMAINFGVAT